MPLTKVASSMLASGASGSGGSTGKNYISSYNNANCNGDFESGSISGWSVFSVSGVTNGVPTSAPSIISSPGVNDPALSLLSSGQLAGQYSLQSVFPTAALREGFISDIFTIDAEDQAKVLTFKFYYQLTGSSGTVDFSGTSSNAFIVGIYAVNGSNIGWIQPAGVYSMTQSSGAGIATGTFQTYSDATQYRFAILCASVTGWTGPATLKFDDFQVGPLTAPIGAPVTDWVDRGAMTIGAVTTAPSKGTIAIDKIFMRRVGDSAQFLYEYSQTTAGGLGSGTYLFSLPSGMNIDTSKITVAGGGSIRSGNSAIGFGAASVNSGTGINANVTVYPYSATQVFLLVTSSQNTSGTGDASVDEPVGSLAYPLNDSVASYKFTFTVPIAGWSSNVQMSNDTDTRVVAASVNTISSTSVTLNTALQFTATAIDTHGAITTGAAYKFTAPVSGIYKISAAMPSVTAGAHGFYVAKNGSFTLSAQTYLATSSTSQGGSGSISLALNSGDYIQLFCGSSNTLNSTTANLNIERLSGPSVVAATETVAEIRENRAGSAIGTTYTVIPYATVIKSTHNTWDGTNNRWVAPVSGTYSAMFLYSHIAAGLARPAEIQILTNNGTVSLLTFANRGPTAATTDGNYGDRNNYSVSTLVYLNAGENLTFSAISPAGSVNLYTAVGSNRIAIVRVGN